MGHAGQPVEVRANFLEKKDIDQLWRNYDFVLRPSVAVPVPEYARARL